ncbi:MAG TPA: hypothetical protein VEY30_12540, partial [Myxococcaceae bacterium]|nr:hypothetical protein [Myxococcaceae bacterium]
WSGLDALSQIAGRAERRPWKVAVREWRGRLEVVPLNEPLSALMTQIQRGVGWKELAPELQKLWPEAQALGLVTLSEPAARFASGPGLG